mgnify:CR=1 FL=1
MSITTINGKPFYLLDPWPSLDESMRIIDRDCANGINVSIRQVIGDLWYGRMWQEIPSDAPVLRGWGKPGNVDGEITAHASTYEKCIRQLAGIIALYRPLKDEAESA